MSSASDFYMARLGEAEHTVIDQRAQDILRYPEDTRPARSNVFTHQLSAKAVRFAYEGAEASHVEIDLNIACGEKIALIGESGSGKSTVLKLLSGARTPQAGEISVVGEACGSSDLEAIALLIRPDYILFHASLNDNLTLFGTSDTCIHARKVARRLGLDGLVARLPQGWETTVSEIAPMMSAGQRQRLMVARALCSRKPLILLDEPTANLDEHACKVTLTAILSSPKTIIVALHDYSLLNAFDRVFRIEGGHPLELSTKQIHEIYS
jgi:ATP-binding cassette subfamily B protein RaxB